MKRWQKITLIVLGTIAVLIVLVVSLVKYVIVPKVTDVVIDKAVNAVVSEDEVASEIIRNLDEQDKEFVQEIIMGYVTDQEAINNIKEYVENNDYVGLKDYAINNLSDEQMEEALDIAEKYKDYLPPEGQEMLKSYLSGR